MHHNIPDLLLLYICFTKANQMWFHSAHHVTKGKGFAGTIKRHNFKGKDATHGNSISHRTQGSTGQCQFPGRVFKGKKMSGQMGNKNVTIQNLEIDSIDLEDNLILIQGSIPGSVGSIVKILPSIKNQDEKFTLASGDYINPEEAPKEEPSYS